jgi:hypothetical protein
VDAAVAPGVAVLAGVGAALGAALEQAMTSRTMTEAIAMNVDLLRFEFIAPPRMCDNGGV